MSTQFGNLLSIVVPVYNESAVLKEFHNRLVPSAKQVTDDWEVIYINDGSSDTSLEILSEIQETHDEVIIVNLSRNFGKEAAMTAGLDMAHGEAVVVIDADLQDPPELIPQLFATWKEGYDVVYAKRLSRAGETLSKKVPSKIFSRCINTLSGVNIPVDTGDYRLLSRRAVEALGAIEEKRRYMKGLFSWIGFPQKAVGFHREKRYAGKSKWNFFQLWNLAIEGITSFTTFPLKIVTFVGMFTSLIAFIYAVIIIYKTLMFGEPVKGYPSLMVVILFIGGIQIFSIGLLGEYLGRMFDEVKNRPLYIVESIIKK